MIRDTIFREYYRSDLAEIYALAGRNDEAIALISGLLKSRLRFGSRYPDHAAPRFDLGPAPRGPALSGIAQGIPGRGAPALGWDSLRVPRVSRDSRRTRIEDCPNERSANSNALKL